VEHESLNVLEESLYQDVELTKGWIRDLAFEIRSRRKLGEKNLSQLQKDISRLEVVYQRVSVFAPGYNPSIDRTRDALRTQIGILREQLRNEEVAMWRDVLPLEKEMRALVQAYTRARWTQQMMEA